MPPRVLVTQTPKFPFSAHKRIANLQTPLTELDKMPTMRLDWLLAGLSPAYRLELTHPLRLANSGTQNDLSSTAPPESQLTAEQNTTC